MHLFRASLTGHRVKVAEDGARRMGLIFGEEALCNLRAFGHIVALQTWMLWSNITQVIADFTMTTALCILLQAHRRISVFKRLCLALLVLFKSAPFMSMLNITARMPFSVH